MPNNGGPRQPLHLSITSLAISAFAKYHANMPASRTTYPALNRPHLAIAAAQAVALTRAISGAYHHPTGEVISRFVNRLASSHCSSLTERQRQCMMLDVVGFPPSRAAAELGIAERTYSNHRTAAVAHITELTHEGGLATARGWCLLHLFCCVCG